MRRREIARKFDEIVAFAEVEKFLDTPVKRYSSGMYVRLAFAVAAHLEPEILIVDEVLAVGDMAFQRKCMGRMREVGRGGTTVLFVSHNMPAVESLCTRALLLDGGRVARDGDVRDLDRRVSQADRRPARRGRPASLEGRGRIFRSATLLGEDEKSSAYLPLGGAFHLRIGLEVPGTIDYPSIGVGIDDTMGQRLLTVHTPLSEAAVPPGRRPLRGRLPDRPLPARPGGLLREAGDLRPRGGGRRRGARLAFQRGQRGRLRRGARFPARALRRPLALGPRGRHRRSPNDGPRLTEIATAMRWSIAKVVTRRAILADMARTEACEWFRAFLRAVPGEVGCGLRRKLYGFHSGPGTRVLHGVVIYYPENLVLGRSVVLAAGCQLNAGGGIEIGDDVLVGPGSLIWSQNHIYSDRDVKVSDQGYTRCRVTIGPDVWIGAGSIILPGVRLAAGTVVAAGSVVTRSTEGYTLVAGTPARMVGRRVPGGRGEVDACATR